MKTYCLSVVIVFAMTTVAFCQQNPKQDVKQTITLSFGFPRILPVINKDSLLQVKQVKSVATQKKTEAQQKSQFIHLPLDRAILTNKDEGVILIKQVNQ